MANLNKQSDPNTEPKKLLLRNFPIKRIMNSDPSITRLFIFMIFVFILMSFLKPNVLLSIGTFNSMAFQFPEYGILSLAMMVAMISGGIDLSVVSIANLTSIVSAMIMVKMIGEGSPLVVQIAVIVLAIIAALIIGILCGLFNGFAVAKIGIPPILITLGTMQLYMGMAIVLTEGKAIIGLPEYFSNIGNGYLLNIPFPLIIFVVAALTLYILLNKSTYGVKLRMFGSNQSASRYSGLNNTKIILATYAISGFLAAVAGLVIVAHTNSAKADYGTAYLLQSILIVVLGGVNPNGGFGKLTGVVMAILTLQFLSTGLNALHVGNFFKDFMWGVVLLLVMVINEVSNRLEARKKVID